MFLKPILFQNLQLKLLPLKKKQVNRMNFSGNRFHIVSSVIFVGALVLTLPKLFFSSKTVFRDATLWKKIKEREKNAREKGAIFSIPTQIEILEENKAKVIKENVATKKKKILTFF